MPLYIQPGITDGTSIRYYWFFTGFGGNGKGTWIMNGYDDGTSTTPQINKVGDYYDIMKITLHIPLVLFQMENMVYLLIFMVLMIVHIHLKF